MVVDTWTLIFLSKVLNVIAWLIEIDCGGKRVAKLTWWLTMFEEQLLEPNSSYFNYVVAVSVLSQQNSVLGVAQVSQLLIRNSTWSLQNLSLNDRLWTIANKFLMDSVRITVDFPELQLNIFA